MPIRHVVCSRRRLHLGYTIAYCFCKHYNGLVQQHWSSVPSLPDKPAFVRVGYNRGPNFFSAVEKYKAGEEIKQIASDLGISRAAVSYIIKRAAAYGEVAETPLQMRRRVRCQRQAVQEAARESTCWERDPVRRLYALARALRFVPNSTWLQQNGHHALCTALYRRRVYAHIFAEVAEVTGLPLHRGVLGRRVGWRKPVVATVT